MLVDLLQPIIIKASEDALSELEDTILSYASEVLGRIENGRVVTIFDDKLISLKSIIKTFLKGFAR